MCLRKIIKLAGSKDYHIRCAVAGTLGDIASHKNKKIIMKCLKQLIKNDYSYAVRSRAYCVYKDIIDK